MNGACILRLNVESARPRDSDISIGQRCACVAGDDVLSSSPGPGDRNACFAGSNRQSRSGADSRNCRAPDHQIPGLGEGHPELSYLTVHQNPGIAVRRFLQTHKARLDIGIRDGLNETVFRVDQGRERFQGGDIACEIPPIARNDFQISIVVKIDREDTGHTGGGLCCQRPTCLPVTISNELCPGELDIITGKVCIDQGDQRLDRGG